MSREGPNLDRLTRRLAECPPDFLEVPCTRSDDGVHVDAVVHDVMTALGGSAPTRADLAAFAPPEARTPRPLVLVLIGCWLLYDDWFRSAGNLALSAFAWLKEVLPLLSDLVAPRSFVDDPDRREELVRLCLAALDLRPEGETDAQAEDRLRTLDSVERVRLIRDTREQHERARKLREAVRKKEAVEAAAKVSREW